MAFGSEFNIGEAFKMALGLSPKRFKSGQQVRVIPTKNLEEYNKRDQESAQTGYNLFKAAMEGKTYPITHVEGNYVRINDRWFLSHWVESVNPGPLRVKDFQGVMS